MSTYKIYKTCYKLIGNLLCHHNFFTSQGASIQWIKA